MQFIQKHQTILIALLLIGIYFGILIFRGNGSNCSTSGFLPPLSSESEKPQKLDNWTFTSIDGSSIRSDQFKDKIIVLNLWATWCPPCVAEIPDLVALQNEYADSIQIIGVSVDQTSPDQLSRFVKRKNINYPIVFSSTQLMEQLGSVKHIPTTFFIDVHGNVTDRFTGQINPSTFKKMLHFAIESSKPTPAI